MTRVADFRQDDPPGAARAPDPVVSRVLQYSAEELSGLGGADFASGSARLQVLLAYLPATPSRQCQQAACRVVLSRLLETEIEASRSARSLDHWSLRKSRAGAPRLFCGGKPSNLSLSMAHSGRWIAVALGQGVNVGVDVERERGFRDVAALADYMGWSPGVDNAHDFLIRWTLWEACVKLEESSVFSARNAAFEALVRSDPRGEVQSSGRWIALRVWEPGEMHATVVLQPSGNKTC